MAQLFLVEKDPEYCSGLQEELEAAGHETTSALGREEALKKLASNSTFEVVILDMSVLREGGLDLISYIKQAQPMCEIVIPRA